MFPTNFCIVALNFMVNSRNTGKKSNFKIFKVMRSILKPRFSHYLLRNTLMISFEDLILIFHI